jgi:hypothetical protein
MLWLIGAGPLAIEYSKVLDVLKIKYLVIGRSKKSAEKFKLITGHKVFIGGLSFFLKTEPAIAKRAIVAVNIEDLKNTSMKLIDYGVKHILLEKPGGLNFRQVEDLYIFAKRKKTDVNIAYNRRFYSSTCKAKDLIKRDGGIQSFNFEFTEWIHSIEKLKISDKVLKNWFFANSSHVVDLAFYLGGIPKDMSSYVSKNILWNNSPALFCGSGKTKGGVMFSYNANWKSAGRWSIELLTARGKYILCPLEKLFFQKKGSLNIKEIKLSSKFDKNFKPGFYKQVKAFLSKNGNNLVSFTEHFSIIKIYKKITNNY